MNRSSALLLAFALLAPPALAAPATPARYSAAPGAEATFTATGKPSLLKIKGHGAKITGELTFANNDASGSFELTLNEFDTGIELRNKHMKEKYLETEKFPKALLAITHVELPKDFSPGQSVAGAAFKGNLTLKGVSKPVEGKVSISGAKLETKAEFLVSLTDFPVGVPSYLGVTVADRVEVQATLPELVRK